MGHHHVRSAADVLEFDADLRSDGMPLGSAHVRGIRDVPMLVGYGFGVDEPRVLDDLAVLTREPHLHRAVRSLDLHAHQTGAADADVHLRDRDGGAIGAIPSLEVFRVGPHQPDELHGGIEAAFDDHRVQGTVVVSHRLRVPFVVVGIV